ncbi:hypothetical protein [Streptomyces thermolilacinus]|uniref:hypothetical protein n=1 Tax=Streptomyces thermolilacinus TaxID=285540 RepID=UPI0033FE40D6
MHAFWKEHSPDGRQAERTHFLKDIGLAGAALMLFAFFSFVGDEPGLTVAGPLFGIGRGADGAPDRRDGHDTTRVGVGPNG